jgi:hypothetical protein
MPAASPAALPETFLRADLRAAEPLERRARTTLVQQLPGGGVPLGGAPEGAGGAGPVALREQQLCAPLRHGGGPGAALPARGAPLRAREEVPCPFERAGARTDAGGGHVVTGRAELAEPARVEDGLGAVDHRQRLRVVLGDLQHGRVDVEQQVLGHGRDVCELERLLELRASPGAVAEVQERLAETRASE